MRVITPSFPCMNSSGTVTESSLNVIKKFFKESVDIIEKSCRIFYLENLIDF